MLSKLSSPVQLNSTGGEIENVCFYYYYYFCELVLFKARVDKSSQIRSDETSLGCARLTEAAGQTDLRGQTGHFVFSDLLMIVGHCIKLLRETQLLLSNRCSLSLSPQFIRQRWLCVRVCVCVTRCFCTLCHNVLPFLLLWIPPASEQPIRADQWL